MTQENKNSKKPKGRPAKKPRGRPSSGPDPLCYISSGEPVSFTKDADVNEDLKRQVREVQETIYKLNETTRESAIIQINTDCDESLALPGSTINANCLRSIAMQVCGLKSVTQLAISLALEPKVKCTYGPNGELKSKEVSNPSGVAQAIAAWQSCLELEMSISKEMQSRSEKRQVFVVPEGGDIRNHKIHAMLKQFREKVVKSSGEFPGA